MTSLRTRTRAFGSPRTTLVGLAIAAVTFAAACGTEDEKGALDPNRSTVIASRTANVAADGKDSTVITVKLLDSNDNPVEGVQVTLEATGTGNVLTQPTDPTDAQGRTRGTLKSSVAETKTVTATAGGVKLPASATVEFVTFVPPAAKLGFGPLPVFVAAEKIAEPLTVAVQDFAGKTIGTDNREVTLSLGANPAQAELTGTLKAKAVDGVATFSDLTLSKPGTGFTLVASSDALPKLPTTTSDTFDVKVGAAASLEIVDLDIAATAGAAERFTVVVRDAHGNEVVDYVGTVKITSSDPMAVLPPTGSRGEYTFVAADKGRHVFTDGVMFKTSGDQTLTVADKANGALSADKAIFVDHAEPAKLVLTGVAGPVAAGTAQTLTVDVLDQFENRAIGYTGRVEFASTEAGATIPAAYQFDASDEGRHVFPNGVTFFKVGTWNLTATDSAKASLAGAINGVQVTAGAPATLAFIQQPRADLGNLVKVRTALTPAVKVQISDAFANALPTATNRITLTVVPPASATGAVLGGTVAADAYAGVATFNDLTIDLDGIGFQLKAESPGLTTSLSDIFDVTDDVPPAQATAFTVSTKTHNSVTLTWNAPGDDGALGTAASYVLRYSTSASMASATPVTVPAPKAGGTAETAVVTGLSSATTYYFELKATDNKGLTSPAATANAATSACPTGYTGAACNTCAAGYHKDAQDACVDACTTPNPCTAPPAGTCTGNTATTYPATGTCALETASPYYACNYAPSTTDCAAQGKVCQNGACVADPCAGMTCTPPAASCGADGKTLTTYASQCTITGAVGVCTDTPSTTDCSQQGKVCLGGACVLNPCAGVTCTPPAATCGADGLTLTTYTSSCSATGQTTWACNDVPATTNCGATGQVCAQGACVAAGVAPVAGDLVVTEMMHSPTGGSDAKRWFEVKNVSGKVLNLSGLVVEETTGSKTFTVTSGVVAADGYYVFGGSTDLAQNGGANVSYAWPSTFVLPTTGRLVLKVGSTVIEDLTWTAAFPATTGKAMNLSSMVTVPGANLRAWYWCDATATLSGNDSGTPGAANIDCGITAPVAPVDWCRLQFPATLTNADTGLGYDIYARVYEGGATSRSTVGDDFYPFLEAEFGYGTSNDPTGWTWAKGRFNPAFATGGTEINNDEMMGTLNFATAGTYYYGARFRLLDPVTKAPSAWTYCDTAGIVSANPPASANYGSATVRTGPAATEIGAVRAAADGAVSLPVTGAFVTYVRAAQGGDSAGFFVQAAPTGPALFVGVDPSTLSPVPAVGDAVSFTVTAKGKTAEQATQAAAISGFTKVGVADVSGFVQDVSNATDVVTALDSYESELVKVTGTLSGNWGAAGTGFSKCSVQTAAMAPISGFQVRVADALRDSLDLVAGCTVTVGVTPMWRIAATAEVMAWLGSELRVSGCPAPKVVTAAAASATSVIIVFDRNIDRASVNPNGSQFTFDNGLTATAASVAGRAVTVTTSAQTPGLTYTATVAGTVTDSLQSALAAPDNTGTFNAYTAIAPKLLINEICTQGPANDSANDEYIELFNASDAPIALTGYVLWYAAATNTGALNTNKFTFPAGATIGPRGYVLVAKAYYVPVGTEPAADYTFTFGLAAGAAQVWLTNTGTGPTNVTDPQVVDMVGYGTTAARYKGSRAPSPPAVPGSIERRSVGFNTENGGVDFVPRAVRTPKSSTSPAEP